MIYKVYRNVIVVLLFIICRGTSCKNCVEAKYQFNMQSFFLPEKDSIQIGDTLWLTSSHSTTFTDAYSNKEVDFSSSPPGANISLFRFGESYPEITGAINDFTFIKVNGVETGGDYIPTERRGVRFDEVNSTYILKIGFVAQKKGVYTISISDALGITKQGLGCVKASISILNANVDKHHYYYQLWKPGIIVPEYESAHAYCFKVK